LAKTVTRYINLSTSTIIDPDTIVSNTNNGIVCFENNVWKFIPANRIFTEQVNSITDPISVPKKAYQQAGIEISETLEPIPEESVLSTFYSYYFGLTEAAAANRKYKESSAFVSDILNVEPGQTYELNAQYEQPDKTSIEFYIIDGIQEKPILPTGSLEVLNEKLFVNLPLRFSAAGDISIYNNFDLTQETLETVNLNTNHIMTANYTAATDSQIFIPANNTVRIKTILRSYPGAQKPPIIFSLLLQRRA
jgi:hypothetical protein